MKKLTIVSLIILLLLSACAKENPTVETPEAVTQEVQPETASLEEETTIPQTQTEVPVLEETKTEEENTPSEVDEEVSEDYKRLTQESDQVSKVKLIDKGGTLEIKVLENLKGSLGAAPKELYPMLKENRVYLIFTKNEGDEAKLNGKPEMSVLLLEGDQSEIFRQINEALHGN